MPPVTGWNAGAAPRTSEGDNLHPSLRQGGYRIVKAGFETIAGAIGAVVPAERSSRGRKGGSLFCRHQPFSSRLPKKTWLMVPQACHELQAFEIT